MKNPPNGYERRMNRVVCYYACRRAVRRQVKPAQSARRLLLLGEGWKISPDRLSSRVRSTVDRAARRFYGPPTANSGPEHEDGRAIGSCCRCNQVGGRVFTATSKAANELPCVPGSGRDGYASSDLAVPNEPAATTRQPQPAGCPRRSVTCRKRIDRRRVDAIAEVVVARAYRAFARHRGVLNELQRGCWTPG